jgi:predicted outer membrane repeat protein
MKRRPHGLTAIGVAVASGIGWEAAAGATIFVNPDGSGDLPTIQAAIEAAVEGDEIVLTDGVFRGEGNYLINFRGKAITVRSQSDDPGRCVIDCEGVPGSTDYRLGFHFRSFEGSDSVVEGITVTQGWSVVGAAIRCFRGSPLVRNCVFENNVAQQGGAINCQLSSAVFENCVIVNSRATEFPGGGAFVGDADVVFRGCTISHNESGVDPSGDRQGGGISIHAQSFATSFVIIEHCIVSHSSRGEAIYCDERSTATISCTDIFGNAGGDWVGCIADQAGQNGNLSADPIFCDIERGNYGLAANSPCAPGASLCGLIGALGVSCTTSGVTELSWGKLKARYRQ